MTVMTSRFEVTLVRRTSDIISLFRPPYVFVSDVFCDIEMLEVSLRTMWLSRATAQGLPSELRIKLENSVNCIAK